MNSFNSVFNMQGNEDENLTDAQRRQLLAFVLKVADVGASSKPFQVHVLWMTRINAEFFAQGDEEEKRGLSPGGGLTGRTHVDSCLDTSDMPFVGHRFPPKQLPKRL